MLSFLWGLQPDAGSSGAGQGWAGGQSLAWDGLCLALALIHLR